MRGRTAGATHVRRVRLSVACRGARLAACACVSAAAGRVRCCTCRSMRVRVPGWLCCYANRERLGHVRRGCCAASTHSLLGHTGGGKVDGRGLPLFLLGSLRAALTAEASVAGCVERVRLGVRPHLSDLQRPWCTHVCCPRARWHGTATIHVCQQPHQHACAGRVSSSRCC
jgi:hypothetical protein